MMAFSGCRKEQDKMQMQMTAPSGMALGWNIHKYDYVTCEIFMYLTTSQPIVQATPSGRV